MGHLCCPSPMHDLCSSVPSPPPLLKRHGHCTTHTPFLLLSLPALFLYSVSPQSGYSFTLHTVRFRWVGWRQCDGGATACLRARHGYPSCRRFAVYTAAALPRHYRLPHRRACRTHLPPHRAPATCLPPSHTPPLACPTTYPHFCPTTLRFPLHAHDSMM